MIRLITALSLLLMTGAVKAGKFDSIRNMTEAEAIQFFVQNGGGLIVPKKWKEKAKWIDIDVGELPQRYDIRDNITLQPVRRQLCGDCWNHSVIAMVMHAWKELYPALPHTFLAHQEGISRCLHTGGGCNGGYFHALDYINGTKGPGLPISDDLLYKGHTTRCNKNVDKESRLVEWAFVGQKDRGSTIEQMKQALMNYPGSLSVTLRAFSHTGNSVYTQCRFGSMNHMTNIIGWQDDERYNGGGYWYMLNSWGESFGQGGIANVAYKDRYGRKCANLGEVTGIVTQVENIQDHTVQ